MPTLIKKLKGYEIEEKEDTLYGYENGNTAQPDPVTLLGYARIFGVSLDGLIRELKWSREHPEATKLPTTLPKEPGMHVTGDEAGLVRQLRLLEERDREELFQLIAIKLRLGERPKSGERFRDDKDETA